RARRARQRRGRRRQPRPACTPLRGGTRPRCGDRESRRARHLRCDVPHGEAVLLIRGSCHCGKIAFRPHWSPDPVEIHARACDCTFCVKHGGVWTSYPKGALEVAIREPSKAAKYAFGTRTADFHVCTGCGAVPVVTSEIDGRTYAVVSVNAFDNVDR